MIKPSRIGTVVAVILSALLVLSGCSSLPLSGQVGESEQQDDQDDRVSYTFNPAGPITDATPEAIISGFITAATGIQNDFATAKRFLTEEAAKNWDPGAGTRIFAEQPTVNETTQDNTYTASMSLNGRLSADGVYEPLPEGTTDAVKYRLTQVDGQWRIAELPDGIMLDSAQFEALYVSHMLYFYDPTYTYAVPDTRWMLNAPGQSSNIVKALLAGPAPYLKGAVVSAFGSEAQLGNLGVTTTAGTAEVDLTEATFSGASHLNRQRMHQQLNMTLTRLAGIDNVNMSVDLTEVELGATHPAFEKADLTATVENYLVGVDPNTHQLARLENDKTTEIEGLNDVAFLKPRFPTANPDVDTFVFLNSEADKMFSANTTGKLFEIATGEKLTAPSVDHHNWAWSAIRKDDNTEIVAAAIDGTEVHQIRADWLTGSSTGLRVSPDGTRIALLIDHNDTTKLVVTGIIRDDQGVPLGLSEPILVQTETEPTHVNWYSTAELLVGATSKTNRVELELVGLGGTMATFKPLLGLTYFTAGAGQPSVYAETSEDLYLRVGNNWRSQPAVIRDVSYPG